MNAIAFAETPSKGVYTLSEPGGAVAELAFSRAGASMIIIEHTDVPDAFRGQGVGRRLVARAVEDARAAGKTIMPLCPFARAEFGKHPEWADVWKR
ncbi:acetyltransferase [Aureimonas sp. Leaf454]|uniref:GNAT family N-acetyltransferase n=1 Tax=Aureimonas sp. Leaf454 TaxID=1736381 RepID=UPI0006F8AD91|nr:GNAT family N-acetyltransferase [Aureimonas sp. Leaf454]KQT52707.1 acetyltransferase [Aureimonas sp. Leaf454]